VIADVLEEARNLGFLGPGPVSFHVEHAAAYLPLLPAGPGAALDLGAGGGLPGLVLASARADLAWTFLDAMAKRTAFLERAAASLGLTNVAVRTARAEEVRDLRGRFDVVVARSFGAPAVTAECAAPLLRLGGRLLVSEPPEVTGDRWAGAEVVGLEVTDRQPGPPSLVVLTQVVACPARYPRRTGMPAKRPLW
jgi:16S rRNA (guanine527-N7)-methyltransferase